MTLIHKIRKTWLYILFFALNFLLVSASAQTSSAVTMSKGNHLYQQAQQSEKDKQYEKALEYIEQAEILTPNNSEIYLLHANIFSKLINSASIFSIRGYFVGMRENLEKVLQLTPNHIKAKHLLVDLYMMLPGFLGGDKERAQILADQLHKQDPIEGNIANANIHRQEESYSAAIHLLQTSIALAPQRLKIQIDLAELLSKVGENIEAMSLYLSLSGYIQNMESMDDNASQQLSIVLWEISALALQEKNYFIEAESAMTTYIKLHTSDDKKLGRGYMRLADIYLSQDKSDFAKTLLNNAKTIINSKKTIDKINNKLKSI
ncbi:MAG: hypothetical protein V7780_03275 [Colwellia sp.]|jgi:tetratricopeptide (TPR) repeat protein|uniref:tetratricopeptide repeat protein n=1 Tax=Colwellia sp. Bg11-12 TaxID=2759817 RepID=UPI0015F381DB|nr:hypothetical protein [Colwellia sp. Bg11-12]MBA6264104.1 hypothetical protein [Colwellia sp. Bg11-12]